MASSVVPVGTSLIYIQATQRDMLQSLIATQAAHDRLLDTLMGDMADLRIIQLHQLRSSLYFAPPPGPSD